MPVRGLRANGIRVGGIPGEQECLASAAAEVLLALVAAAAGILHPAIAAKGIEGG